MIVITNGIRAFVIESVLDHICLCPCVTSKKDLSKRLLNLKAAPKYRCIVSFLSLIF